MALTPPGGNFHLRVLLLLLLLLKVELSLEKVFINPLIVYNTFRILYFKHWREREGEEEKENDSVEIFQIIFRTAASYVRALSG